jgi:hypothetical protein
MIFQRYRSFGKRQHAGVCRSSCYGWAGAIPVSLTGRAFCSMAGAHRINLIHQCPLFMQRPHLDVRFCSGGRRSATSRGSVVVQRRRVPGTPTPEKVWLRSAGRIWFRSPPVRKARCRQAARRTNCRNAPIPQYGRVLFQPTGGDGELTFCL